MRRSLAPGSDGLRGARTASDGLEWSQRGDGWREEAQRFPSAGADGRPPVAPGLTLPGNTASPSFINMMQLQAFSPFLKADVDICSMKLH